MKRLLTILAALAMTLVLLLPGCAAKTYTDSGQTIEIKQGQEFVIALGSNPTTGYSWQANFDESLLKLVESNYGPGKESREGLVGAGGIEYFKFRALGKGQSEITLIYKRPWEEESIDQKLFTVNAN